MRTCKVFAAALVQLAAAAAEPPAALALVQRPEEELLLLALELDGEPLPGTLPAYRDAAGNCRLPLGETCRLLSLAVRVDPGRGAATGFLVREACGFRLDVAAGQVQCGGRILALERTRLERHADDLYVEVGLLEAWLPLRLQVDAPAALLRVRATEELPIQAERARERKLARLRPTSAASGPELPLLDPPYSLWDPPFVEQSLDLSLRPNAPPGSRRYDLAGTTFLAGDLLYMSSRAYFTSSREHLLENARLTLARRDPERGLLGPLAAGTVELGDIFGTALPLIGARPVGRGLQFGNFPDRWLGHGERYELEGDLLPGWTVELYQNGILVAFQRARGDGRYAFLDLPLVFGVNDFRLVFYGPEGQRREQRRRLDRSQAQAPAGELLYNAAGVFSGPGPGRYQLEAAYGLSRQLDLSLALAQAPGFFGPAQRFAMATLLGSFAHFGARLGLARDLDGGSAASASLSTGWGGQSLTVQHTALRDFSSAEFLPTRGLIAARTRAQLNLGLPWAAAPLHLDLEAQRDRLRSGGASERLSARLATCVDGYSLANTFSLERQGGVGGDQRQGSLLAGKAFRDLSLRVEAGYGIQGLHPRLRTVSLQGEWHGLQPWTIAAGLQHDHERRDPAAFVNLNRSQGKLALGLRASWSRAGGGQLGLGLHVALGREPRSGRWLPSARPMAFGGAVSAVAFVADQGRPGPGQEGLEGVALAVDGMPRQGLSPRPDIRFQPELGWGRPVLLTLDQTGLEDPFLRPALPGYRVLPRPGKVVRLDFPLVQVAEVTGSVLIEGGAGAGPLAGLGLELLDGQDRVCRETVSAFDGFFFLGDLLPGNYRLRVAPAEAERLGLVLPAPRDLQLGAGNTLVEGIRICVSRRPGAAP
jgi:hypothetical protein